MIEEIRQCADHLVKMVFKDGGDYISCQATFSVDGHTWEYASLYAALDAEHELDSEDYIWNQAQTLGTVRLYGIPLKEAYWNPYLNIGKYCGIVQLKVEFITAHRAYSETREIELRDLGVVYLDDWEQYLGSQAMEAPKPGEGKWALCRSGAHSYVTMAHKEMLPNINIPLPGNGVYNIYIGLKKKCACFFIRLANRTFARFNTYGESYAMYQGGYANKENREIYWDVTEEHDRRLEISPSLITVNSHYDFGCIAYIKLVPVAASALPKQPATPFAKDTIMHYEGVFYDYQGSFPHRSDYYRYIFQMRAEELQKIQPGEVTYQPVRIGMKALYHSDVAERQNMPSVADDGTPWYEYEALHYCDPLQEMISCLAESGIRLTINVGMNRPYIEFPMLTEKFVRENEEVIKGGFLDYSQRKVQEYALRLIDELIEKYESDGLFFDFMRTHNNQTRESLVHLFRSTKSKLRQKEQKTKRKLELKTRIPADLPEYYHAMKDCVEQGWVDVIVPSNFSTTEPVPPISHYLNLCKGTATKVYGCIDGWKRYMAEVKTEGSVMLAPTPDDIRKYVHGYERQGADGIFFYQAEFIPGNPYVRTLFNGLAE